ncbi:hypothetical protein [Hymenobacter metallilatus]|uniref:Uncharacterized protein n=1 Tax=Hymenobacter metallilatus TaxID=2493666 RepID=A0A428JCN6_9BACT|nr:hypothetical protein [Hymenobacter metallilatus]RSK29842.1 hypothetical protein EI290_16025 [Hymenobacter metallilatus]
MLDQNQTLLRFTLLSELLGPQRQSTDPIGWEEMGVTLHRDPKYHGLSTEYMVELGFVKEGRAYLTQVLDIAGPEAEIDLLVEVYDPNTFCWETYYQGRINMSGATQTATEFRCLVEKPGFTQKFLNREDTTVDLLGRESVSGKALPAFAPTTIELHSKAIRQRYEVITPDSPVPPFPDYVTDGNSRFKVMYFGFGSAVVDEFGVQETYAGTVTMPDTNPEVPVYTTQERGLFSIDFNIQCLLRIQRQNGKGDFDKAEGKVYFRLNDEPPIELFSFQDAGIAGEYRKQLTAAYRITRPLNIGDRIYLYGRLHVYDISGPAIGPYQFTVLLEMQPGSYFRMQADTQTDPTPAAGLLVYEALDRLAQALTDQPVALRSTFYGRTDTVPAYPADGPGSLLLVTSGFQVRGFPLLLKSLYATWKDLFDSLYAAHWLGYGTERLPDGAEVLRVEQASYFYAEQVVLTLAAPVQDYLPDTAGTLISNLLLKELPDRTYITAKAGWQKWQTQRLNGLDEFNATREWALPLVQPQATYDAVGNYITAGFYLESTRRQRYDATATTDTGSDNENFLICLLRAPLGTFQTERNQLFAEVSGLYSPDTAYNLRLSPARMLRRHGPALAAGLRYQQGRRLRFSFGEGNNTLSTRLPGETAVAEHADIPVAALGEPLWRAQSWEFTAPCTRAQAAAVLANPRGRVRFQDERGQWQEGWLLDFKHTLSREQADFTLLRCHTPSA